MKKRLLMLVLALAMGTVIFVPGLAGAITISGAPFDIAGGFDGIEAFITAVRS